MEKRKVIFGTYNTAETGAWTVAGLELTSPDFQTNLVQIPGRDGPIDLSTVLTNGEPVYNSRKLTVVLENSDGDRAYRERLIRDIIAQLDGYQMQIWLPDKAAYYLQGRVHVVRDYNDLAHASVTVTATCDPWMYSNRFQTFTMLAGSEPAEKVLTNSGRRAVVPVVNTTNDVTLVFGENTWTLSAGTYQLPELVFSAGDNTITYSGSGRITITYREAVLL